MPVERFERGQRVVVAGTGEAFDGVAGTVRACSNVAPHPFAWVEPDRWPEYWPREDRVILVYAEEVEPEAPDR